MESIKVLFKKENLTTVLLMFILYLLWLNSLIYQ